MSRARSRYMQKGMRCCSWGCRNTALHLLDLGKLQRHLGRRRRHGTTGSVAILALARGSETSCALEMFHSLTAEVVSVTGSCSRGLPTDPSSPPNFQPRLESLHVRRSAEARECWRDIFEARHQTTPALSRLYMWAHTVVMSVACADHYENQLLRQQHAVSLPKVYGTYWLHFLGRYHELGIPAVSPAARHVARRLDFLVRARI